MKEQNKKEYDVIIIGAGPSGSIAAHWASKIGLKCAIIDAKSFPRDKVCGDNLPSMVYDLLKEVGLNLFTQNSIKFQQINGFILNGTADNYHYSFLNMDSPTFNIPRYNFDFYLWSNIPYNVDKYEDEKVISSSFDLINGKINIETKKNIKVNTYVTKYIIAADGANSWIRKNHKCFSNFKIDFSIAKRIYIETNLKNNQLEVKYLSPESFAYFWDFPLNNNRKNIGIYLPFNKQLKVAIKPNDYIEQNIKINKNYFSIKQQEIKGAPIPTFNENNMEFSKQNIFLVGDAGGFCEPIFGHGIDIGMLTAKIAIQAIANELKPKRIFLKKRKSAVQTYNDFVVKNIVPKFKRMRKEVLKNELLKTNEMIKVIGKNMITNKNIINV